MFENFLEKLQYKLVTIPNSSEVVGKLDLPYIGNGKWCIPLKTAWHILKEYFVYNRVMICGPTFSKENILT